MLEHIPMDKALLWKWLTAGYIDQRQLHPTLKGTPQGGIVLPFEAILVGEGLARTFNPYPEGRFCSRPYLKSSL